MAAALPLAVSAVGAEPTAQSSFEQGEQAFRRGAFSDAVRHWTDAATAYANAGQDAEQFAALTHLAQAYSALGQYRSGAEALQRAVRLAEASGNPRHVASALAWLGDVSIALGPPETAETLLRRSIELARGVPEAGATGAQALNSLGNLLVTQGKHADAIAAYTEAASRARAAGPPSLAATALVNRARAERQGGKATDARATLDTVVGETRNLAASHDTAYTLVGAALGYRDLRAALPGARDPLTLRAAELLTRAGTMAATINDDRAASHAWGHLGALYEEEHRWDEALQLTRQAIVAAQRADAPESLYRWQWQAGRLLTQQTRRADALASYRRAVATLQGIRSELAAGYGAPPAPFRESIGPVYFELVDLLLKEAATVGGGKEVETLLVEAREVVELFKAAELRDFFRDDCVDTALSKITRLDTVSQTAAIVYPILLRDRTELLLTLPAGMKRVTVPVGAATMTKELRDFRRRLEKRTTNQYLPHARRLYDWLIRPMERELATAKIDTLIFVPDGPLRTIPVAALHDGQQFLISKYALGITPGLNLTDPRPLRREGTKVLAVGVTEAVQGFPPLPSVAAELDALRALYPSTTLVDRQFLVSTLERVLKDEEFSIVHIASHGEFGGTIDKTFVLAFDDKVTMDRLDQLVGVFRYRDDPLELLTLSACDTAAGDDRAALGLAGVAVKAGARSAVATLWNINDDASAGLVSDFYRELRDPSVSRARALQRAQVRMLSDPRYEHPGYWAPFLLINNWL